MRSFLVKGLMILVALQIPFSFFNWQVHKPLPMTSPIVVEMPKGGNAGVLAKQLKEEGVVKFPLWVKLTSRAFGYDKKLKAGEYKLLPGMSLLDVLEKVSSGKVVLHRLTLPEGLTTNQMLKIIENNELLTGPITEPVKEGELLPETYSFHKGESRNKFIVNAKKAMDKALNEAWEGRDEDLPLNSQEELLILASIIEKETGVDAERQKVASVFVNRLNKDMLLQTDPTVIYAITLGKSDLGRSLKRKDLQVDSPYNTYKTKGLPPTPICNPGLEALQAAAHPADTDYLFFVADGKGGHNFAKSLDEHNRNVKSWVNSLRKQK